MSTRVSFTGEMQGVTSAPRSGWIKFPFGIRKTFGKGRLKVHVVFDHKVEYRGSLVTMSGEDMILVRADVRKALGKNPGDMVHVELWEDLEERTIEIPDELQNAFEVQPEIKSVFERLSYTKRREITTHISDAKKPETRVSRVNNIIKDLLINTK